MRQKNQTARLIGGHYRSLVPVEAGLPPEIQALLLRLALREVERAHYGRHVSPTPAPRLEYAVA